MTRKTKNEGDGKKKHGIEPENVNQTQGPASPSGPRTSEGGHTRPMIFAGFRPAMPVTARDRRTPPNPVGVRRSRHTSDSAPNARPLSLCKTWIPHPEAVPVLFVSPRTSNPVVPVYPTTPVSCAPDLILPAAASAGVCHPTSRLLCKPAKQKREALAGHGLETWISD